MVSIVLATRNSGKLREIRQVLSGLEVEVIGLDAFPGIGEPEETGSTFAENARHKASYYASATGCWCLADDSGIVVDALDGRPGVLSARYASDRRSPGADKAEIDQANNRKLLEEMANVPAGKRTARFVCHLALSDGESFPVEATGQVEGKIALEPAGENGFGYDPIFIPNGTGCTMAELTAEQKNAISHRGKAVRRFAALLEALIKAQPGRGRSAR